MQSSWRNAGSRLAATLLLTAATHAQVLDLGGDDDANTPKLGARTWAGTCTLELENEIADRQGAREDDDDSVGALVATADTRLRMIASNLLSLGDTAGSRAVLAGMTLYAGREDIDRVLAKLRPLDAAARAADPQVDPTLRTRRDTAVAALTRFVDAAERHAGALRGTDAERLDAVLARVLAPLAEAVGHLDSRVVVSHWPTIGVVDAGTPAGGGDAVWTVEQFSTWTEQAALEAATRRELETILDYLRRGAAFSELRPRLRGHRVRLMQAVALVEAVDAATWLTAADADAYRRRVREGLVMYRDAETRDAGRARLAGMGASAAALDALTALSAERDLDTPRLVAILLRLDGISATGDSTLGTLQGVLDRMVAYRALPEPTVPRDLRVVHRQAVRAYVEAEADVVASIETLVDPAARTDPAWTSLLVNHRECLENIGRIRQIRVWMDALSAVHQPAGPAFFAQAKRLCGGLLDPTQRPHAVRMLARFQEQFDRYDTLPFEAALRAGTPAAAIATGGMQTELVIAIDRERRRWADAWGTDDPDDAAARMERLYRLTATMQDAAGVTRGGPDNLVLDRWAAWQIGAAGARRSRSALFSRLKLATASFLEGDDAALATQLDRVDRNLPAARLVGRLTARLEPALETLPPGAAGTLGQVVFPPGDDAWFGDERDPLADICRFAIEERFAREQGDAYLAEELRAFINGLSERLLGELE